MTTVADIRLGVQSYTGDLSAVLFTTTDIIRYINYCQIELIRKTKSVQYSVVGTNAVLSSFDQYGGVLLPAGFIIDLDVYWGQTPIRLVRMPVVSATQSALQTTSSQPTAYSISDYLNGAQVGQRHLVPYPAMTPGLTGQYYRINYVGTPAAVTADGDVITLPPIFDEILVMSVVRRCKIQENDWQAASYFDNEVKTQLAIISGEFSDHSDLQNFQIRDEVNPVYSVWEN